MLYVNKSSLSAALSQQIFPPEEKHIPLPRFVSNTRERQLYFLAEVGRKVIVPETETGKRTSQIVLSPNPNQPPYPTGRMTNFSLLGCPPQSFLASLLILGFSLFQESRRGLPSAIGHISVVLLRSFFCDGCWLNSSREARAEHSSTGMEDKYTSTRWWRRCGNRCLRRTGLSKKIQGSVKRKREVKGLTVVVFWQDRDTAE